jgi:hypothetical protein
LQNPANGLAVIGNGAIGNANLYFFSWATFIMALAVFMHLLTNASEAKGKNPKFRRGLWVALIATSVVALASSVGLWQNFQCEKRASSRCNRLVFSITLSCITGSISFFWVLCGQKCDGILDWILGMIMLICWSCGVAFLTFGRESPASFLGNLYFSSWIGFLVSCALASGGINDILVSMRGGGGGDNADSEKKDDNKPSGGDEEEHQAEPTPAD